MPTDQAYYWTPEWQANEREAVAQLEAGNYCTFVDAADAIVWLLDEETP
jgi:hypothetical protein